MAMTLSKREKYIAYATAAVLGLLLLDHTVLTPLMDQYGNLDTQIAAVRQKVDDAQDVIDRGERDDARWKKMASGSLLHDESSSESQILNAIRDWGQSAGVAMSSQKRERTEKQGDFVKLTYRATGTGRMSEVARFLWLIQNSSIPARISDLQLTSRKEGTDDLNISIGVSTVYLPPKTDNANRLTAGLNTEVMP